MKPWVLATKLRAGCGLSSQACLKGEPSLTYICSMLDACLNLWAMNVIDSKQARHKLDQSGLLVLFEGLPGFDDWLCAFTWRVWSLQSQAGHGVRHWAGFWGCRDGSDGRLIDQIYGGTVFYFLINYGAPLLHCGSLFQCFLAFWIHWWGEWSMRKPARPACAFSGQGFHASWSTFRNSEFRAGLPNLWKRGWKRKA